MHKPQAMLPPLRRLRVITYRVTLDVPLQLVIKVSSLLRKRREELGTRNGARALTCCQQAVFIAPGRRGRGTDRSVGKIGALSGGTPSMSGLASGLIETMREVGGAVGVAVVSTVLVTQAGTIAGSGRPAGRALTAVTAFHDAYWVKFAAAALGVLTATTAFPRTTRKSEPATPGPSRGPVDPEPAGQPVSPATGSRPAVRVAAGITDPGKGGWRPSPGGFGVVGSGWVGSFRFAVGWPGVSWPGGNRLFGSRC